MAWEVKWAVDSFINVNCLEDNDEGYEFDYLTADVDVGGEKLRGGNLDCSRGSMDGYHST